jgi:hypothetical protein
MTRADIIRMAREAGATVSSFHGRFVMYPDDIERFATLVAAAEREACAQVCERRYMGDNSREDMEARRCAEAIRARGKP